MSKFDTHGGYFAPKDYTRVNEGGSHEENPNGGVQLGVDPEGAPNLLEEGEPVYKDYVYSDNIEAEEAFLEENHLPKKYAGKLYSKIADDFVSEAEERPLDPISRNGLEVLLGRLADAQEGQKQRDQRKELEQELSRLSPEELDALEAMLAQGGEDLGEAPGVIGAPEQMGPAEPVQPMPVEQAPVPMPMMYGGLMKKFGDGGDKKKKQNWFQRMSLGAMMADAPAVATAAGWTYDKDGNIVQTDQDTEGVEQLRQSLSEISTIPLYEFGLGSLGTAYRGARGIQTAAEILDEVNDARRVAQHTAKTAKAAGATKGAIEAAKAEREAAKVGVEVAQNASKASREAIRAAATRGAMANSEEVAKAAAKEVEKQTENLIKNEVALQKARMDANSAAWKQFGKGVSGAASKVWNKVTTPHPWMRYPLNIVTPIGAGIGIHETLGYGADENYPRPPLARPVMMESVEPVVDTTDMVAPADSMDVDLNFNDEPGKVTVRPSGNSGFIIPTGGKARALALGGRVNRFDGGGWADFLKRLAEYGYSRNPSAVAGKYAIDRRADVWGGRTARQIEADKAYQDFTDYVLANSGNADVRSYLKALDAGVADGTPLLFKGDELVDGWDELFRHRRTDGDLGIYHLNPEDIGFLTAPTVPAATAQEPQNALTAIPLGGLRGMNTGVMYDWARRNPTGTSYVPKENKPTLFPGVDLTWNGMTSKASASPVSPADKEAVAAESMPVLPTWPRYAGAIGSGLLGLYNVFQQPDRYVNTRVPVHTPEGRIHLQNEVYRPIDQNMIANAISAQGNSTVRVLRNSGLGPSASSAILAADNNITGNLGTGFIQAWDANNQRRNAVIAANNQAEGQRAQFDANMDYYRTAALNNAAQRNAQNDLLVQRLNYGAEGDKYAAISNQIANGLQALSGIGRENFSMNQVNTNPANLGYRIGPNGEIYYFNPWTRQYEKSEDKNN